ncbi:hypothetical protein [Anatilimnocola floriformis]|uniref:hypothetical protein n=1 Tax=Anatilimnocola floriformis TaxID=2948575 RepID=UPI0020C4C27C|nr:hypothetical protein [Anatilimnocola floriformis]
MKTLAEINDEEIRDAEWVNAVDPDSGHWETVWGLDELPPDAIRRQINILDVNLTENDLTGLLRLIDRVEQVRGRLSQRVQALRQALILAADYRPAVFSDKDSNVYLVE